jgi:CheY-like chemotaxis protein/HPt (histidine-containing phosphotransfer) domain-containing protein
LLNLVGNAVKFTPSGEVTVRLDMLPAVATDASGNLADGTLRFEVIDTGIGIAPEIQGRLFQPFSQGDSSTSRRYGGTGLGLAVCRRLVTLMGGEIGVVSEAGQGSTFWFSVRLGLVPRPAPARVSPDLLHDVRVLVVDDNAASRAALAECLERLGATTEQAASAAETTPTLARAVAEQQAFDLAILEMQLPDRDGVSLARQMRADPDLAATRLILLTSPGRREPRIELGHDADATIPKPIREDQLLEAVARLLGKSEQAADPEPAESDAEVQPYARQRTPQALPRLLVVEDSPVNQRVMVGMLKRLGFRADVVLDGAAAIEAVAAVPYRAVLMDCELPELDGYATTREIRRHEPSVRRIPIIAITGNDLRGERERCLAAGMDDYVGKPVRIEALAEALRRWVQPTPAPAVQATAEPKPDDCASSDTIVDTSTLARFAADEPELLADLIEDFLRTVEARVALLWAAARDGDSLGFQTTAHMLKGEAGMFGALALETIAIEIETRTREGTLADAVPLLDDLEAAVERTGRALAAVAER